MGGQTGGRMDGRARGEALVADEGKAFATDDRPLGFDATTAERHLRRLQRRLPEILRARDRLSTSREARQVMEKYAYVDDLEQALDGLEEQARELGIPLEGSREGSEDPGAPTPAAAVTARQTSSLDLRLFKELLSQKRSALARERVRFAHDLAASSFHDAAEASAATLSEPEARRLEREVNEFCDEYALTLAQCRDAERA